MCTREAPCDARFITILIWSDGDAAHWVWGSQPSACPLIPPLPPPLMAAQPKRRVVVTGLGVVSCLGHEHGEFYDNLLAGKSGISLIEVCVCVRVCGRGEYP